MVTQPDLIISTQNLTKSYGKRQVVSNLNLAVPRGSICGFLGSNGAGKSTTIKLLLGLVQPTSGVGTVFGKNIVTDSVAIRDRVGFLGASHFLLVIRRVKYQEPVIGLFSDRAYFLFENFKKWDAPGFLAQSPSFYGYLTARETLQFVASFFFSGSKTAIAARIEELIELVGLSGKADRPVKGFSGGEKQRLGIAQAAINDPELIILDEPASALDPLGRRDVLKILESFRGRSTVFYSTHILDDVQRVSDRVVILERGRLIAQGRIEELSSGDRSLFHMTVRGDGLTVRDKLLSIPWVKKIELETGIPDLSNSHTTRLQIHVSDSHAAETELLRLAISDTETIVTQFERSSHNLEDIFVNLVTGGTKHD